MKLAHQTLKSKKKSVKNPRTKFFCLQTSHRAEREWDQINTKCKTWSYHKKVSHTTFCKQTTGQERKKGTHKHKRKQNKPVEIQAKKTSPNPNTKTQNKLKSNYLSFFGAPKQTFTKRSSQNQSSATYLPFVDWCKQFAAIPRACCEIKESRWSCLWIWVEGYQSKESWMGWDVF